MIRASKTRFPALAVLLALTCLALAPQALWPKRLPGLPVAGLMQLKWSSGPPQPCDAIISW